MKYTLICSFVVFVCYTSVFAGYWNEHEMDGDRSGSAPEWQLVCVIYAVRFVFSLWVFFGVAGKDDGDAKSVRFKIGCVLAILFFILSIVYNAAFENLIMFNMIGLGILMVTAFVVCIGAGIFRKLNGRNKH
ncbi:hypothetical protein BH11VER1_BH11VER1_14440 [soil metagenome]